MKVTDGYDAMFNVCWWNGGGGIIKRLKFNPGLRDFLDKKPDLFTYGESQISRSSGLFLDGYKFILHRSFLKVKNNYRRGIVIFYLEKYHHQIAKVYASKKYDIVWIQLKTSADII